jgi:tRNA G37 N-methylase Trm5
LCASTISKLERDIGRLGDEAGKKWQVKMKHLEKVKTYAPRVWHVVADVECRPA